MQLNQWERKKKGKKRGKEGGREGTREGGREEALHKELAHVTAESEKFQDLWLASWGPRRANGVSSNPKASREGQDLRRVDFPVPVQRQEKTGVPAQGSRGEGVSSAQSFFVLVEFSTG